MIQESFSKRVLEAVNGNQHNAAAALGISVSGLNHYLHGKRTADDEAIAKMADFLGENAALAVAQHRAEHAKNDRMRSLYSRLAAVAITLMLFSTSAISATHNRVECILC